MVKEDPEAQCFYAEGLKEKIVASAEEVLQLFGEAERRRRVAHTRYNEVSSRSHSLLTLCVESSEPQARSSWHSIPVVIWSRYVYIMIYSISIVWGIVVAMIGDGWEDLDDLYRFLKVHHSLLLEDEEAWTTRVGRLVIVDLAGNERLEAAADYVAESSSINKSLFFLGKAFKWPFRGVSRRF